MADEVKKIEVPKHLSEITGSAREQLATKVRIISDHGYSVWEALCARSGRGTKR